MSADLRRRSGTTLALAALALSAIGWWNRKGVAGLTWLTEETPCSG